jgi:uncharacterized protein (UPF0335 family)
MEKLMVVDVTDTETAQRLTAFITNIERMEDEKKDISESIKDEFTCAKSAGFDTKIMKVILKMRKKDAEEIQEEEALIDVYRRALGMLS